MTPDALKIAMTATPRGLLRCPKCASSDVWMRYCDSCANKADSRLCRHGEPEHFHRGCRQCDYHWRTDDIPDAKVVCSRA